MFGALRHYEGPADTDFRFTSGQWDEETHFYYLRARYYDPAIGRFAGSQRKPPWSVDARPPSRTVDIGDVLAVLAQALVIDCTAP